MKKNISIPMLFTAAIFLAIFRSNIGWAQPDPNSPWPMFHHDGRHTGMSSSAGPSIPALLWSYRTEENYSSPTIGSGEVAYIGATEGLYAFNPTGSLNWSYLTQGTVQDPALGNAGSIYVTISRSDDDGEKGWYTAFNTAGSFQWSYSASHSCVSGSFNIGADGSLYAGSGANDGNFYALSPSGSLKWSYQTSNYGTYYAPYSVPALGTNGEIYFGSNNFYSFSPNGSLNWSYGELWAGWSSPTVGINDEIYIGSPNNLQAFHRDGSLNWSYRGDFYNSQPASGSGERIYANSDSGNLYVLNADGSLCWSYAVQGPEGLPPSSPALGSDGRLYIASDNLYALTSCGALNWSYAASYSPSLGSEGRLYVEGIDTLYCFGQGSPPAFMGVPNSSFPSVGDRFTFDVICQPMSQSFDAYGVIIAPGGTIFSFDLPKPMSLRTGLKPLALSVPGVPTSLQHTLFISPSIPETARGKTFTFIIGLVPPGAAPRMENIIPGYLWEGQVRVR